MDFIIDRTLSQQHYITICGNYWQLFQNGPFYLLWFMTPPPPNLHGLLVALILDSHPSSSGLYANCWMYMSNLSLAYHPQTYGETNELTLEQYHQPVFLSAE